MLLHVVYLVSLKSGRVATHQKLKNSLTFSWLFTDLWTIFTDLKLARWMIKNSENHWSKLLFLQTSLKSLIFHDTFLTENIIPWLFTDFYKLLRFSLTFNKIPWHFPDLENFYFSLTFPDRGNPEGVTFQTGHICYILMVPLIKLKKKSHRYCQQGKDKLKT